MPPAENRPKSPYRQSYRNWDNVQDDCMLCEMEKKTEWYIETPRFVVAEKLGGGPFIVSKEHTKELSDEQRDAAEHLVGILYDDFDLVVRMGMVPDHWHAHIVQDRGADLSDE